MSAEAQSYVAAPLVEQLDAFAEVIRQRDSARRWAVEMEQRIDLVDALVADSILMLPADQRVILLKVLAGEQL